MSNNPDGHTGKRSVRYVRPGLTQVIYEDRILDIKTKETGPEFASKVKARTGKTPAGYKTKEQAYKDRRARNKAAAEKKKAAKTAASKSKAAKKTPAKKTAAPKKSKTAARMTEKPKKMNALEEGLASGKYILE